MGKNKFWLAIIPLIAVWFIAVGTSMESLYSLLGALPEVRENANEASTVASEAARGVDGRRVTDSAVNTDVNTAERSEPAREHTQPAAVQTYRDTRPLPSNDYIAPSTIATDTSIAARSAETGVPIEEYEQRLQGIADPRIRNRVIPAIED